MMTKDEAAAVGVRIAGAMNHLRDAQTELPVPLEDENDEQIADGIEEALQALQTAYSLCRNISGA